MPELVEVAQRAWKGQWTGRRRLNGKTIYRDGKMVTVVRRVVHTTVQTPNPRTAPVTHQFVFFPKPEHFRTFLKAGDATDYFGPADDNPHAIATLSMRTHAGVSRLDYAQGHYIVGKEMPRSLATRYAGWLARAFEHALDVATRHHANLHVSRDALEGDIAAPAPRVEKTRAFRTALLHQIAKKRGLQVVEHKGGARLVVIRKRPAPGEFDI